MSAREVIIDDVLADLIVKTRNSTLETAAKVAKLYGASDEVIEHILMLKEVPKP
jgi:hypothetical protein